MRKHRQKGFTLMELMVVIVIVAILAAVAVPLYINYVKDAQRTEAKGAIGAIITAEQVYYQQNPAIGYTDLTTLENEGKVDLTEVKAKWSFAINSPDTDGFTVTATGSGAADGLCVTYTHSRSAPPVDPWDETCAAE